MKISRLVVLLACGSATDVRAFNLETHGLFTSTSFSQSILNNISPESKDLYFRLGFDRLPLDRPFSQAESQECTRTTSSGQFGGKDHYIDAQGTWFGDQGGAGMLARCPTLFEQRSMPPFYTGLLPASANALGQTAWLRFEGWLMRGAIREDDYKFGKYDNPNLTPDQDPWNDEYRSLHHFYDPRNDTHGLGTAAASLGATRSTTWALGVADNAGWVNSQTPDPSRGNHFSYMDARRFYWLALTYNEGGASGGNPFNELKSRRVSNFRQNLWASTLKSIGHVVHLLQDSASPQHVRAEPHSFLCNGSLVEEGLGNQEVATRTFENFANYRVTVPFNAGLTPKYSFSNLCDDEKWIAMFGEGGQRVPADTNVWTANAYPIPKFSVQRKFFTTRTEDSSLNSRRGLADYTNRGFYTERDFAGAFQSPPPLLSDLSLVRGDAFVTSEPGFPANLKFEALYWQVPDAVAPSYVDPNLQSGKAPIASVRIWELLTGVTDTKGRGHLTLNNYVQIQDMLAPRAIAYTTGLINFFFRGKLEIEPNPQKLFGVVDLGQPHTVSSDGYPIITATNKILGFEKIRLKVRNLTEVITESGTNVVVPQIVGTGKLVAVARYHRNPCYKPDLSGERTIAYTAAPPPALGVITEPVCPMGVRTNYQEISVSAELPISAEADLPGGRGGAAPASVDKTFDFSNDPIPVNATDLFIQVVYRGQLGDETDGIAVGNLDVQEPTFFAAWNNTDYYFSEIGNQWLVQNPMSFPSRGVDGVAICAGSPSQLVYRYIPENGPGLPFFVGALTPGVVRLALIFGKRSVLTSRYPFRVNPLMLPSPSAQQRLPAAPGQERQASREIFTTTDPLPAPSVCQFVAPLAGSTYWCFDPIQKRRGQNFGDLAQPIYYTSSANAANGPDVDAPPNPHTPFPGLRVRDGGVNRFNEDVTLINCPDPTLLSPTEKRAIELREEAWSLGLDLDAIGK